MNFNSSHKFLKFHEISRDADSISSGITREIHMALSLIESGCLATSINNETVFIYKAKKNEYKLLSEYSKLKFGFEFINKPEFPNIVFSFKLFYNSKDILQFEYPFSTESEDELELIFKLTKQEYFDILFIDEVFRNCIRVNINQKRREKIRSTLEKITIQIDKV